MYHTLACAHHASRDILCNVVTSVQVLSVDPTVPLSAMIGSLRPNAVTTLVGTARVGGSRMQLTFLPDDDPSHERLRTCVISLPPSDAFWKVTSADDLYEALGHSFPQVALTTPACHTLLTFDRAEFHC